MWDPSSLTRDEPMTPALGAQSLNHWTAREVPTRDHFKLTIMAIIFKRPKSVSVEDEEEL